MAQVIQLYDSEGLKVLDSVSLEYEDSFSLESFKDLNDSFYSIEPVGTKCLIIARVQTWDPKQPDKSFYSYYNAFLLNKILFQTQMYLGKKLIHRLQVLNPLTNTDIIGHIQYFMVQRKINRIDTDQGRSLIPRPLIGQDESELKDDSLVETTRKVKRKSSIIKKLMISTKSSRPIDAPLSGHVKEVEEGIAGWTISAPAVVMVNDHYIHGFQTPLPHSPSRRMTLISPRDGKNQETFFNSNFTQMPVGVDMTSPSSFNNALSFNDPLPSSPNPAMQIPEIRIEQSLKSSYTTKPIVLNNLENNKVNVPHGVITRFAIPLTQDDVRKLRNPTTPTRKRLYSFANMKSAIGDYVSYDEWLIKVKEDFDRYNSEEAKQYALVQQPSEEAKGETFAFSYFNPPNEIYRILLLRRIFVCYRH